MNVSVVGQALPGELVVQSIETRATGVIELTLVSSQPGMTLPAWDPGAHITLHLKDGLSRSYSLIGDADRAAYRIAVGLDRQSRGGSQFIHHTVQLGDRIRVDSPVNSFRLVDKAPCIFVAGGIGVTPFVSMIDRMALEKRSWRLFFAARTRGHAAYLDRFEALASTSGARLDTWLDDQHDGGAPDLRALIARVPDDWHLYCCGPSPMIEHFLEAARGRPSASVHTEYFRAAGETGSARSFIVELARSGRSVEVPSGSSILDALMMQGIDAPYSCYEGLCGTCETRVLEGVPEHRDQLLTERARASNQSVIICRSGSLTPRLVLDL